MNLRRIRYTLVTAQVAAGACLLVALVLERDVFPSRSLYPEP